MADKNEDKLPSFDFGFDELPSFDFNFDELFSESDKDVLDACLEAEQTADESKKHATADASVAKKARFAEVAADDLNKLLDDAQAKKTKINTKWAVCVFKGWSTERGIKTSLENMKFEELDKNLCQFYAEARSKNGESYSRATLLSLRNSIERYLSSPPNNLAVKLSKDPRFTLSNKVLDARIKQLKKDGKENTTHKPPIDQEDIEKIKKSKVILPSTPHSLLKNVWFHVSLYWCRRGREGQRSLTKHSFRFEKDGDEREYVTMTHDECTKNHPGGLADVESYEKFGRMYKTDSPTDGYSSLKLYLSKVNPDCEALFQYPKRNCRATDNIWYENRPLGSNKLAKMMVDISTEANLSRIYTNHSVRATAITFWSKAGLPDRQIMAISGHRSESSLKSYHSRPSSGQLRQCSEVLSSAMGESIISTLQPFQPSCTSTIQPGNSQEEQGLPYGKMFTGCSINNLQITFNR